MNKKTIITTVIIVIVIVLIVIGNLLKSNKQKDGKYQFIWFLVARDALNVEVNNMAESLHGCIHDYTLTTEDLKKFEKADLFIQNGKGLESFSNKIIELYPKVKIIDSAENIKKIIEEDDETNSHIWLSIENYISQVNTIAEVLKKVDAKNSELYESNRKKYIDQINTIKGKYNSLNFDGYKAVCLNESLVYLLDEIKMDITSIETDHEQSTLSAEQLKEIIKKMKEENIKTIFIDKGDDRKIANTLQVETGANICEINSGMNGDNKLDAYISIMNENYEVFTNRLPDKDTSPSS